MSKFSAEEKHREAEREVAMRETVYQRYNRITWVEAQRRIAIMKEIADEYAVLAEKERLL